MENQYEAALNRVNTCSCPSDLKITDIRFTDIVGAPMDCTLMKIYTNQGLVGPVSYTHLSCRRRG